MVNVAFPAVERSFPDDGRAALAWVITGYAIVFAHCWSSGDGGTAGVWVRVVEPPRSSRTRCA